MSNCPIWSTQIIVWATSPKMSPHDPCEEVVPIVRNTDSLCTSLSVPTMTEHPNTSAAKYRISETLNSNKMSVMTARTSSKRIQEIALQTNKKEQVYRIRTEEAAWSLVGWLHFETCAFGHKVLLNHVLNLRLSSKLNIMYML